MDLHLVAIAYPLNQNIGSSAAPSQDRLNAMADAINKTLNSIQDTATKILSSSQGALHFNDLKDCIGGLVQQGGLHDGESCVVVSSKFSFLPDDLVHFSYFSNSDPFRTGCLLLECPMWVLIIWIKPKPGYLCADFRYNFTAYV